MRALALLRAMVVGFGMFVVASLPATSYAGGQGHGNAYGYKYVGVQIHNPTASGELYIANSSNQKVRTLHTGAFHRDVKVRISKSLVDQGYCLCFRVDRTGGQNCTASGHMYNYLISRGRGNSAADAFGVYW